MKTIKDTSEVWNKEFSEFLSADASQAPNALNETVLQFINQELNPAPWRVFSKVGLIQLGSGFLTLLFCPQFGFSLTGIHGIMHLLMRFGEAVCMFGCGVVFVGSSLLISALLLRSEEVQVLRKNEILQVGLLSLLTVGVFLCLGAEVFELMTLVWITGSVLGGVASLEIGWMTRKWLRARVIYG